MKVAKDEDDALNIAYAEGHQKRGSAANQLSRRYTRKVKIKSETEDYIYQPEPSLTNKCRRRNMSQLSLENKIKIVHDCLLEKKLYKDVALKHHVKVTLVSYLIRKAKNNINFLKELR